MVAQHCTIFTNLSYHVEDFGSGTSHRSLQSAKSLPSSEWTGHKKLIIQQVVCSVWCVQCGVFSVVCSGWCVQDGVCRLMCSGWCV